jgi:hypothetical protein
MKHKTQKPAKASIIAPKTSIQQIGLRPKQKIKTTNGGLDCVISTFDLYDSVKSEKNVD